MGKVYRDAESAVYDLARQVMERYHEVLIAEQFKFGIRMVTNADGPAITHHGTPALATIKKLTPKDHVFQNYDAIIDIDGNRWDAWKKPERMAILDHEITHIVVVKNKAGETRRFANGRMNWGMRPDDWSITGFAEVVGRWGEDSAEYKSFYSLGNHYEQLWLPFLDVAVEIEKAKKKGAEAAKHAANAASKSKAKPAESKA